VDLRFDVVLRMPFGGLAARLEGGRISEMLYVPASIRPQPARSALARELARQVRAYLEDPGFSFDLPLAERGSDFQRAVWKAIVGIPSGTTRTYGDIARHVRSAPRAVGQACGANWFSLVVPCHRVLAAGGLGGFGHGDVDGYHLGIKRWLLRHEGAVRE
jgi:methylated-DNA-[protein]-cysteine S-methyltransferase